MRQAAHGSHSSLRHGVRQFSQKNNPRLFRAEGGYDDSRTDESGPLRTRALIPQFYLHSLGNGNGPSFNGQVKSLSQPLQAKERELMPYLLLDRTACACTGQGCQVQDL
jgi:hypothetical protein